MLSTIKGDKILEAGVRDGIRYGNANQVVLVVIGVQTSKTFQSELDDTVVGNVKVFIQG